MQKKPHGRYGNNMDKLFQGIFKGKVVLVTGHTGFKGAWLSLWLKELGARVIGYSLPPPTTPSLFETIRLNEHITNIIGNILDYERLLSVLEEYQPEIVFHLAAQSLVRVSYEEPRLTYETNVMGTVNILETIRKCKSVQAGVIITSDKCYENREWYWGYRENEPMGGYDPYSNSKACSELITTSYRKSFFNPNEYHIHHVGLASARAGNVIGGGDWAQDRLIPDCIRSILRGEKIIIRNPNAIRPWQHVLEPLSGYLLLAQKLYSNDSQYAEGWNFGPDDTDAKPVEWIVQRLCAKWGESASYKLDDREHPHEAHYLKLDCSKAKTELDWYPRWDIEKAIDSIIEWTHAYKKNEDLRITCLKQIEEYSANMKGEIYDCS
ncbi:CDP-glucose 4,6-dehydratase [Candidatus Desantisbacteria bacterium CG23_combo_of_CG06-09_8_20_14_all_40_23]|uniref:CDP-glucose 4,6-dehydratase n=3 Tax=unclassified Candidatus Desantisiibacteriota TaxID=3106372 RepID=A0A2H0A1D7_9BACT|nr:MAG: CDP-glucose 4,6-dehydratase [Candidatus Desantisbacteria bacterium CG23_combo_of_CG06-09_8_20_14_all_40_23]